jgi:hypothetical protein
MITDEMKGKRDPIYARSFIPLPVAFEWADIINDWHYRDHNFVPVSEYPPEITVLENEVGCVVMVKGVEVLPILRVCVITNKPASGKKAFLRGTDE